MATITPPTAQQIYDEAGHNGTGGLSFQHFSQPDDTTVLGIITSEILPTVQRRVDAEADKAAYPEDFPLATAVWQVIRPAFSDDQIAEEVANQEAVFVDAIRLLAAARLLRRVTTTSPFWIERAKELREEGETMLQAGVDAVSMLLGRTVTGQKVGTIQVSSPVALSSDCVLPVANGNLLCCDDIDCD